MVVLNGMNEVRFQKDNIRRKMVALKHQFSDKDKKLANHKIINTLLDLPQIIKAKTICCYQSFASEVDTKILVEKFVQKIVFPEDLQTNVGVFIIPGLAFDKKGYRLGRGRGFYDRLLAKYDGYKIALCYDFQIVQAVPHEIHDIKMDLIITEKEIIHIKKLI